jgi:hypothetical protein
MERKEQMILKFQKNKHKIIKYFRNNREDLWFLGAVLSSFLFIVIKFGLIYTLPLLTLVCSLKCILIYISKNRRE